eukprot:7380181-Prymnesium_polylepis.2
MANALEREKELRAAFSPWGIVTACKVKVDGARQSPGYGFIYFKEASSARALLAHIEEGGAPPSFLGKTLNVREAFYKEGFGAAPPPVRKRSPRRLNSTPRLPTPLRLPSLPCTRAMLPHG